MVQGRGNVVGVLFVVFLFVFVYIVVGVDYVIGGINKWDYLFGIDINYYVIWFVKYNFVVGDFVGEYLFFFLFFFMDSF